MDITPLSKFDRKAMFVQVRIKMTFWESTACGSEAVKILNALHLLETLQTKHSQIFFFIRTTALLDEPIGSISCRCFCYSRSVTSND